MIASWASRYLELDSVEAENSSGTGPTVATGEVLLSEQNGQLTRRIYSEHHQLIADEPC